jgi:hypothetical protein
MYKYELIDWYTDCDDEVRFLFEDTTSEMDCLVVWMGLFEEGYEVVDHCLVDGDDQAHDTQPHIKPSEWADIYTQMNTRFNVITSIH